VFLKNTIILAVIWCALVFPNVLFNFFNKDAKLKRAIHPWWMWGNGFVMMVASLWLSWAQLSFWLVVFIVAINAAFSFYYSRAIVFCDHCGMTFFRLYPFEFYPLQNTVACRAKRDTIY
jgi:hypothetical protein